MPKQFWKRGRLTRWQWFWSRLGVVIGAIWLLGIVSGFVAAVVFWFKKPPDEAAVFTLCYIVLWGIGGFLACWTCCVLGGFTIPFNQVDPWE